MRWVVNAMPKPLCPQVSFSVPILQETGLPLGRSGTGRENVASTEFRTPDHTVRSPTISENGKL